MRIHRGAGCWLLGVAAVLGSLIAWTGVWAQTQTQTHALAPEAKPPGGYPPAESNVGNRYLAPEQAAGRWTAGSSMGFLGSTPDGTALALNGNVNYHVTDQFSVGPLVQVGVTDDMTQVGLSGQGKYGIPMPGTQGRGKFTLQGGMGFVHSDFLQDDTSWLVPLGVGYEYALESGVDLTATSLVNITDLHTGFGTGGDVMPGFAIGFRF